MRGQEETFTLLTADGIISAFATVDYNGTTLIPTSGSAADGSFTAFAGANQNGDDGLFRRVEYSDTQVDFTNYLALAGDANGDGTVDVSDFNIWNANKFTVGTNWASADFDGNGVTDVSDFNIWNANKFTLGGYAAGSGTHVIEVGVIGDLGSRLEAQRRKNATQYA